MNLQLSDRLVQMGVTLEALHGAGWTDANLICAGHAVPVVERDDPCIMCGGSGSADDSTVSDVTLQLIRSDIAGKEKYGATMDRTDLSAQDWLQHMSEELLDGAKYALAAKREIERLQAIESAVRPLMCAREDAPLSLDTFNAAMHVLHSLSR